MCDEQVEIYYEAKVNAKNGKIKNVKRQKGKNKGDEFLDAVTRNFIDLIFPDLSVYKKKLF